MATGLGSTARMLGRGHHISSWFVALVAATGVLLVPAVAQAAPSCPPAATLPDTHSGAVEMVQVPCDDPSGTGLNWVTDVAHDAQHGFVQYDQTGGVYYTANTDYAGPDSFTIVVSDNEGGSVDINANVSVVNQLPTCADTSIDTPHDQQGFGFPDCDDQDDDPWALTYVITAQPAHGTASVDFGSLIYTPDAGYAGPDSFQYAAADNVGIGSPATASVNVTNEAPVCQADSERIRTGKPFNLSPCYDPDGDAINLVKTVAPSHGTLSLSDDGSGGVTYTPATGYTGDDTFTVKASDGIAESEPVTIDLTITPNHRPVCSAPSAEHTRPATKMSIFAFCSDEDAQDANDLTYSVVSGVSHGTLTPQPNTSFGSFDYTPTSGYSGSDSFTYQASDGELTATATQPIHVSDHPMCSTPPPIVVRSGRSAGVTLDCTQPVDNFGVLTYVIDSGPSQGSLTGFDEFRTYTANATASGADSFTFHAAVGTDAGPSVTEQITTGSSVNNNPTCVETDETAYAGHAAHLFPFCTDPDGDPLSTTVGSQPSHGSSSGSGDSVTYTPNAGYEGSDAVPYGVTDGHGGSTNSRFLVNVKPPEAPRCLQGPVHVSVRPGSAVDIELDCTNPQDDAQTYSAVSAPTHGTLGEFDPAGVATYTGGPNAATDTFTVVAHDPAGDSSPQQVTVTIDPNYNRAPSCTPNFFDPKQVAKNTVTQLELTSVCTDPDGDPLTFTRDGLPAHGTLSAGPAAQLTYTPATDYTGADSFSYHATDSRGASSFVTTFNMTVTQSLAPTCVAQPTLVLRAGQARSVSFDCSDPNNQQITYEIVTAPAKGSLNPSGSSTSAIRLYTAGPTTGADSFTYRATNAGGQSPVYTQNVTIDPNANVAPQCMGNSAGPQQVLYGRPAELDIDAQCFDQDGDALTFTTASPAPQHGTVTASGGVLTYTANNGYTGTDQIGYTASDGHGGTTQNVFTIDAGTPPPNAAPVCDAASATTPNATPVIVHLDCTDADGDDLTLSVVSGPDAAKGSLGPVDQNNGAVEFTPAGTFAGAATFTFKASDGVANSAPATATVTVQPAPGGGDPGGSGGTGGTSGTGGTGGSGTGTGTGGSGGDPNAGGGSAGSGGGTTGGSAGGATGGAGGGAGGGPSTLKLTLGALPKVKLSALLSKGLAVKVTSSGPSTATGSLILAKKLAKQLKLASKDVAVATVKRALKSGSNTLVLKLTAKAKRALKKARSVSLKLTVAAVDAARHKAAVTKTVVVKR